VRSPWRGRRGGCSCTLHRRPTLLSASGAPREAPLWRKRRGRGRALPLWPRRQLRSTGPPSVRFLWHELWCLVGGGAPMLVTAKRCVQPGAACGLLFRGQRWRDVAERHRHTAHAAAASAPGRNRQKVLLDSALGTPSNRTSWGYTMIRYVSMDRDFMSSYYW
jgi:hypothetical protein